MLTTATDQSLLTYVYLVILTSKRIVVGKSPRVNISTCVQVHPADEPHTKRNTRPGLHCYSPFISICEAYDHTVILRQTIQDAYMLKKD